MRDGKGSTILSKAICKVSFIRSRRNGHVLIAIVAITGI